MNSDCAAWNARTIVLLEIMWNEQIVAKNEISRHFTGRTEVSNKTVDKIGCVSSKI
jgi:hypothetical protein